MIEAIKTVLKKLNVQNVAPPEEPLILETEPQTILKPRHSTVNMSEEGFERSLKKELLMKRSIPRKSMSKKHCPANVSRMRQSIMIIADKNANVANIDLRPTVNDFNITKYLEARKSYFSRFNIHVSKSEESLISVCEICQEVHPKAPLIPIAVPIDDDNRDKKPTWSFMGMNFKERLARMSFRKANYLSGRKTPIYVMDDNYSESYYDLLRLLSVTYSFVRMQSKDDSTGEDSYEEAPTEYVGHSFEDQHDEEAEDGDEIGCCGVCKLICRKKIV